jgi:hypothetical protein
MSVSNPLPPMLTVVNAVATRAVPTLQLFNVCRQFGLARLKSEQANPCEAAHQSN